MLGLGGEETGLIADRLKGRAVGLIYMDIGWMPELSNDKGRWPGERVRGSVELLFGQLRMEWPSLFSLHTAGDDFFFYAELNSAAPDAELQLFRMSMQLRMRLKRHLTEELQLEGLAIRLGCAPLVPSAHQQPSDTIYDAVKRAIREAQSAGDSESGHRVRRTERFLAILQERSIQAVYQPIVSLAGGDVFGYEALVRGPKGTDFQSPRELFAFAEDEGLLYSLDRLAREKAIAGCTGLESDQRLFINIPADVIHDPDFTPGRTLGLLEKMGLAPHNVVFEITERCSIEDFSTAKKILQHYRSQGYQIAIDDAGAGYSSLQAIAELQPDYIKVDRSLIHNIHKDKIKEHMLETFVAFAEKMNIRIIAEGIELPDELFKLMQMGIHFGQGYLLARPSSEMAGIDDNLARQMADMRTRRGSMHSFMTIGTIASQVRTFDPGTHISEVARYFREYENELCAVVVQGGAPVGLVMREKLFQQLAGQYGIPLYWNRPISKLMDCNPLIVDELVPLDQVSQMSTARETNNLYDYVVITCEGAFLGTASIRSILESITKVRIEQARIANPLTGLPGNLQIQRELGKRIIESRRFSVIYADLDFFKWYNDRYGFQKGDELIQFTADVLQEASGLCGLPDDFVGHIGGDDFIVLSRTDSPYKLCEEIIRRFDSGVVVFMDPEMPGQAVDREGRPVQTDRVNISLSLIVCECGSAVTAEYISREAAKLKKRAKAHMGSIYFGERIGQRTVSG
jgi:EAL domain-containing protein (putative c-di-GMP-specific phosphodiesterase class I)/GGDEF domain-containing protein